MRKEVLNSHLHVYFRSLISIGKHEHPAKGKGKAERRQSAKGNLS